MEKNNNRELKDVENVKVGQINKQENDNKKSYMDNEFVKAFLTEYDACHSADDGKKLRERVVGNNGYKIGTEFVLTGEIRTKTNVINGIKQVYIVLPTTDGLELSLMSLMGVSSLKGYKLNETVIVEYDDANGEKSTREVISNITEADFTKSWQPKTRNFLELAAMIADGRVDLRNKRVKYLGVAVKPFKAKEDNTQNGESYKAGYMRAIETRLWQI